MTKNIFELSQRDKDRLGIVEKQSRSNLFDRLVHIFNEGVKQGKKGLTLAEITAGYYNLYCKNNPSEKIYNMTKMYSRLHYHFYGNIREDIDSIYDEMKKFDYCNYYLYKPDDRYTYIDREYVKNHPRKDKNPL